MTNKYTPPIKLKEWRNDIPDGELYGVYIASDQSVCCTSGRFAHASGAISTSWQEFLAGEMNSLVAQKMGTGVLHDILYYLKTLHR
ncbi:hypothetical protein [Gallaecimonas xiamenensis]|uniref:hypothetical protein n=1 Tax=Gallaecimonas xiamenensis TaxID=1207039 RepID=UPI000A014B0A|nr:hypothetical protein [Gallaecimonas xiamenensis]